ncbi:PREDICTED: uncharacterized protein LOC106744563 [Dinoponera quadriceps]|uniref:Uncharacterized protein LOC106744563 n=1 Tax=Dinoponera quadriceps TaxID=609295 RepID=A0A6P3X9F0_DINQU|nr:PREDICTED: uncharacterized protein LOC106744563 [Dinoponera quadriceps]
MLDDIGFRIVGKHEDGKGPIAGAGAAALSSSPAAAAAAAAAAAQGDGPVRPEASVSEMREVLLAELLDVPSLQIRVRLSAALSVPVLRPRQQMVPLDLQSYQEVAPGTGSHAEQALLVQSDVPELARGSPVLQTDRSGEVP